jgi:Predicted periplasmic lipoprotein (DUF2291)
MATATALVKRDRRVKYLAALVVVGGVMTIWPPFHIQRLRNSEPGRIESRAALQARQIADHFWSGTLAAGAVKPVDIRELIEQLQSDPAATQRYGHTADYGGSPYYFLQGDGRVTSVDSTGLWLDVGAPGGMKVLLLVGPIFGNALRDSTGRLPMKGLGISQFNAISAELDRLAETQGQAGLQSGAKVGAMLRLVAAGEVDDSRGYPVLELAPVRITLQ